MKEKISKNEKLPFRKLLQDPTFLIKLYEGNWEAESLYEKYYLEYKDQFISKKVKPEEPKPKLDPLHQKFLDAEDDLLKKICLGEKRVDEEFSLYLKVAADLLAKSKSKSLEKRLINGEKLKRMLFSAQVWKRRFPKSESMPRELILQGHPLFPITDRSYELPATPPPVTLATRIELLAHHMSPYIPQFTWLNSDVNRDRDQDGPYDRGYLSGPIPDLLSSWFSGIFHGSGIEVGAISATVKGDPYFGRYIGETTGWYNFITNINVIETGHLALQLRSTATMSAKESRWVESPPLQISPYGSFHLTHSHIVHVVYQKPENEEVSLNPNQNSIVAYSQYYDQGYRFECGPDAEAIIEDCPSFKFREGREWKDPERCPLHYSACAGKTTINLKYPKISIFEGPCKIKIIEQLRYWLHIESNTEHGELTIDGFTADLDPIQWSLHRVVWVPRGSIRLSQSPYVYVTKKRYEAEP